MKSHSGVISTTKEEKSREIGKDFSSQARRNDSYCHCHYSHFAKKNFGWGLGMTIPTFDSTRID